MCRRRGRRIWRSAVLGLGLALTAPMHAQAQNASHCDVSISASNEVPSSTHLLTPVLYQFDVTFHERCHIAVLPHSSEQISCNKPSVELVPNDQPGKLSNRIQVKCEYLSPGFFFRPPFSVQILDGTEHAVGSMIPAMHEIEVKPFLDESGRTRQLEDNLVLMSWNQVQVWVLILLTVISVLLLSGIAIAIWRYRRHKQLAEMQQTIEELKPIERFSLEIEQLVNIIPVSIEEYKAYHDSLSNALRQYIRERTQIDAPSCTTFQLCKRLKKRDFSQEICEIVMRILGESDRVKFAYEAPGQGANMMLLRDAANLANLIETHMIETEAESTDAVQIQTAGAVAADQQNMAVSEAPATGGKSEQATPPESNSPD